MSDKIARLGIERDNDLMYYIKNGDVWATPRKQKGQPKGKAQKVADAGLELDYSRYIYYLDGDGDVARKARALGGGRAKKAKPSKPSKPSKAAKPTTAAPFSPKRTGKKSEAQLDREIEECLAQVRKKGGNGISVNGTKNGNGGNGTKSAAKPATKKKTKKKRR